MITQINPAKPFISNILKLGKTKNKAEAFYTKNARGDFFMLESIARLNKKAFEHSGSGDWQKVFKKFEDVLGEIDYYDVIHKELLALKLTDKELLDYFDRKKTKAFGKLEKLIEKKDIFKQLPDAEIALAFDNTTDKITLLKKAFEADLSDILQFMEPFREKGFKDMELQVHELRRKLRWLSIYAQAYGGVFVLENSPEKFKWEKQYVTPEAKKSPYNTLPVNNSIKHNIQLNKTVFYALSTLIKELGQFKDEGLTIEAVQKAIRKTRGVKKEEALAIALQLFPKTATHDTILQKAFLLADTALCKEHILSHLVLKTKVTKPIAKKS